MTPAPSPATSTPKRVRKAWRDERQAILIYR
jgi:hypothetical protein